MSQPKTYQNSFSSPAFSTEGTHQSPSHKSSVEYPCDYSTSPEPHTSITMAENNSYDDTSAIRYNNPSTSATALPSTRLTRRQITQPRASSFQIEAPDFDEEWGPATNPRRRRFREGDRQFRLKQRLWAAFFGYCVLVMCLIFCYYYNKRAAEFRLAELGIQRLRLLYGMPETTFPTAITREEVLSTTPSGSSVVAIKLREWMAPLRTGMEIAQRILTRQAM